ncbi:MAG TPA: hypothetical protein VFV19_06195 [Candidatus Polarisedimenticolaceae bacterium]|nr:hypothetical protein [Candidatus Polarisedimenticolaceae bacterium]
MAELENACTTVLAERRRVQLDLSAVGFVDRAGAALIEKLRSDDRVRFAKVSAFVAELMKGGAA